MTALGLGPLTRAEGAVRLPGSKSISNRVLLLAALARGATEEAAEHARSALEELLSAMHEDLELDVSVAVANALIAAAAPEWETVRPSLELNLGMIAQRTTDEEVRVRWFRGPIGRELTRLVGPTGDARAGVVEPEDPDAALLKSLIHGQTNREIAEELGIDETALTRRLAELYARIGASSRAEATAFAFRERVL